MRSRLPSLAGSNGTCVGAGVALGVNVGVWVGVEDGGKVKEGVIETAGVGVAAAGCSDPGNEQAESIHTNIRIRGVNLHIRGVFPCWCRDNFWEFLGRSPDNKNYTGRYWRGEGIVGKSPKDCRRSSRITPNIP